MEATPLGVLAGWAGAAVPADPGAAVTGVSTDSRTVRPGELFVALRGPTFDGHAFVAAAVKRGAAAAVVDRGFAGAVSVPLLRVADTLAALGAIAAGYRAGMPAVAVGITGSDGKTTTKELLGALLGRRGPVLATQGNLNNEIGVPLTLLRLGRAHRYAVIEMGMNHPGEIARLATMARPEAGLITNIGWAHAGYVGGRRGIAAAKAELLEGLDGRKLALLNRDSPFFGFLRRKAPGEVMSFGLHADADVRGEITREDDTGFVFRLAGEGGSFRMNFWNPVWICTGLAALAGARAFGIPAAEARDLLEALEPLSGRGTVLRSGGVTIVDESYNANPESMRRALQALAGKRARRRFAVIGDMAELGRASNVLHRSLGAFIRGLPIERIITVGKASAGVGHALGGRASHAADPAEAVAVISGELAAGDCVLVKGSRVMALEQVVAGILKHTGG